MEIPIITRKFLIESKAAAQENTESSINKEIYRSLGDIFTAGSILLPSFTTPVFLLRLRRLSSTFSVNSHLTVLRHTPKAEAMLDRSTEIQASVHSRKKDNSCLYIQHSTHHRGRSTLSPQRFVLPAAFRRPPHPQSYMIQKAGNMRYSAPAL